VGGVNMRGETFWAIRREGGSFYSEEHFEWRRLLVWFKGRFVCGGLLCLGAGLGLALEGEYRPNSGAHGKRLSSWHRAGV